MMMRKTSAGIKGARVAHALALRADFDPDATGTAGCWGTRVLVASAVLMCLSAPVGVPAPSAGDTDLTCGACLRPYLPRYLAATWSASCCPLVSAFATVVCPAI